MSLEDLEKKMVVSDDLEKDELEKLLTGLEEWAIIDPKDGYVKVKNSDKLSERQKIQIILTDRYLINKLQQFLKREIQVSPFVTIEELEKMLMANRKTLSNRLGELKKSRVIRNDEKGNYGVTLQSIPPLIEELKKIKVK